jgi:hypothetical protein
MTINNTVVRYGGIGCLESIGQGADLAVDDIHLCFDIWWDWPIWPVERQTQILIKY